VHLAKQIGCREMGQDMCTWMQKLLLVNTAANPLL